MDTATGDIRAVEFTSSREGDSPVLPDLLDQIPPDEQIDTVTGDGAFDTRRCHTAIGDRGGTAVIPIRKNGRLWKEDCPAAAPATTSFAPPAASVGRTGSTGPDRTCEAGSRRECPRRFARTCGAEPARPQILRRAHRLTRSGPDRQTAEVHIRVALMNRFNALGTAEIERVA